MEEFPSELYPTSYTQKGNESCVYLSILAYILYIRRVNSRDKEKHLRQMIHLLSEKQIEIQRIKAFSTPPVVNLVAPCKVGEGVLRLTEMEKEYYEEVFEQFNGSLRFFIPASGSGSRMFQFLFEFLNSPNESNRSQVERFLNSISEFAFFRLIPADIQQKILDQIWSIEQTVAYLLQEEGLDFGSYPKGLIPFHHADPFILNPFQEQLLQGLSLGHSKTKFHFTIQKEFEKEIKGKIMDVSSLTGKTFDVEFSEQLISSNAIAFKEDQEPMLTSEGTIVTRPSGHGALLENLNTLNEDLILIKNIDNLQHFRKSGKNIRTWKRLSGLLISFREELLSLYKNPSLEGLQLLNAKYQVYSPSQLDGCVDSARIRKLLNRPVRVCGMVKNVGQPGGGPFWVEEDGVVTKQIVEKAQISTSGEQMKLMVQSTHFNPVMLALCPYDLDGKKLDLNNFRDDNKFFIVEKDQNGSAIRYIEQPGLWNGSMSDWNTLFVEVSSGTFSPVKTILDLLEEAHKG